MFCHLFIFIMHDRRTLRLFAAYHLYHYRDLGPDKLKDLWAIRLYYNVAGHNIYDGQAYDLPVSLSYLNWHHPEIHQTGKRFVISIKALYDNCIIWVYDTLMFV